MLIPKTIKTSVQGGLATLLLGLGLPAAATNGYFSHGYSLSQKALGGAGTALTEDALIATINPAGMVWVDDSLDIGFSLFTPIRDYRAGERGAGASNGIMKIQPGFERSHNEYYPIPAISYKRAWGDSASWSLTMYGNGGLNTEYRDGGRAIFGEGLIGFEADCGGNFGGGAASGADNLGFCGQSRALSGVDMAILFLVPTVSVKLGERSSIGVSAIGAMNRFAAQGLAAFARFSNAPDKVSDNGHEITYGGGYRIGILTGLIPGIGLGASYQSRVWMDPFEEYSGLFGEQGDFDIPESWNVGISIRLGEHHRLVVDYQNIDYSSIGSVGSPFDPNDFVNNCAIPRLFGDSSESPACLGSASGPGFGWREMRITKFGYQYQFAGWKLRLGYSDARQPIPSSEVLFNVLAPGVIEKHYTLGAALRWSEKLTLEAALMYAPDRPVRGPNPLSNTDANLITLATSGIGLGGAANAFGPDPDDQELELNMRQYEFSIGMRWHLGD